MSDKSPYDKITAYRRRQRYLPTVFAILAVLLVSAGLFFLWVWFSGRSLTGFSLAPAPTPVPAATMRPTVTLIPTRTEAPTATLPPTLQYSPTALIPFPITVQPGDTLVGLAELFGLDPEIGVLLIWDYNGWEPGHIIQPGDTIIIPHPDAQLFTPTPIPTGLAPGTEILYRVLPGDSLGSIAEEFLSTVEAIIEANDLDNPDAIGVGDWLLVPVNLVTPQPSDTPLPGPPPSITPFPTPTPTFTTTPVP